MKSATWTVRVLFVLAVVAGLYELWLVAGGILLLALLGYLVVLEQRREKSFAEYAGRKMPGYPVKRFFDQKGERNE